MLRFKTFLVEEKNTSVEVDAYHGSGKHFTSFDQKHARLKNDYYGGGIGYFSSNHDVAKTYAKSMSKETKTPHVYHTKIKMKKVFDVDHKFSGDKLKHVLPDDHDSFARGAGLMKLGVDKYKVLHDLKHGKSELSGHQVFKGLSKGMNDTAKARDHLIKKGYDGLRYNGGENMNMATKHDVYIPYNAKSIKIHKVEKI